MNLPLLTILTLTPVAAGLILLCTRADARLTRKLAITFCLIPLALVSYLWCEFNNSSGTIQFQEKLSWIPSLGVDYFLGIDGIGLLMVTLSAAVIPFAVIATAHEQQSKLYYALMLFLQAG